MKEGLLQYLACPVCGGEIVLAAVAAREEGRGWTEVLEGELACRACARRFAVRRGVPRFVDAERVSPAKAATAANFGWQWQHFTQHDERYAEQLRGWLAPVEPEFFRGKNVLEGGCGKGRHTRLAAEWGARAVVGIDASAAVETAFAATRELEHAHIVQADIYQLPLKRAFDYAFSVGVLHHLPDPRGGFGALAAKVRPGGHLSAWVYGAENNGWLVRWVSPLRERVTSRISRRALLHLSKLPAALMYTATKLVYGPLARNNVARRAVVPHLFYHDYLCAIAPFGWREQHTIVFDHLVAPVAYYISHAEFADWWRQVGATDVVIGWHNSNSWRGFGRIKKC
ncbi:MAG TPA: methyltransferase domain-containing protein [Pyrinomonadaceae bacterium]|jgi:SAM-dependent methyltransferase